MISCVLSLVVSQLRGIRSDAKQVRRARATFHQLITCLQHDRASREAAPAAHGRGQTNPRAAHHSAAAAHDSEFARRVYAVFLCCCSLLRNSRIPAWENLQFIVKHVADHFAVPPECALAVGQLTDCSASLLQSQCWKRRSTLICSPARMRQRQTQQTLLAQAQARLQQHHQQQRARKRTLGRCL